MPKATPKQVTFIYENTMRTADYQAIRDLSFDQASEVVERIKKAWRESGLDIAKRQRAMREIGLAIGKTELS